MRFLELLILVLAAILPFVLSHEKIKLNRKPLAGALVALLLAHLIIEGARWQLAPIYLTYVIGILLLINGYQLFRGGWLSKSLLGGLLILMLGVGFVCSTVLPVFELPDLIGSYDVGARYLHVTSDHDEYITPQEGDQRELMIKVWYPANISGEQLEPYLNEGGRQGFAMKYGLPKGTFGYLDHVKTHTFQEPDVAAGTFPVLIFSHGYYSNAFGYHALIEEIVSHGFIVFNLNHTYESVGTQFPTGEVRFYDHSYEGQRNNQEMASMVWEATQDLKGATTMTEKHKAIDHVLKNYYAADISDRWEVDIAEVVERIGEWSTSTFLAEHMDTSRIGVLGHSQAGAAIGQALLHHPKISAGINIDGVQWGQMVDTFLTKPFMLLSSDWPDDHPDFNEVAYDHCNSDDFYLAKINGSGHSNFMDIPYMINLPAVNEAGVIDPTRCMRITANLVVEFFERYLNDANADLLELSRVYPELDIERKVRKG